MSQANRLEHTPQHNGAAAKIPKGTYSATPSMMFVEQAGTSRSGTPGSQQSTSPAPDQQHQPEYSLEQPLPLFQAVRRFPKVVMYCMGITLAVIGWGYDLAVVGAIPAVDPFLADYGSPSDATPGGELIVPAHWLSLWLALPPVASALGAVVAGWFGNRAGRRASLMLGCAVSSLAVAGIFSSNRLPTLDGRRALFTAAISLQGFSVGVIKTTCVTYVSENAPTALRGPAMGLFPTFTLVGQLIGAATVFTISRKADKGQGGAGYAAAFASQWAFAFLVFALACFAPESPAHLIRRATAGSAGVMVDELMEKKALASCTRLFAPAVDARAALRSIARTVEEEQKAAASRRGGGGAATYAACFRGPDLRRTLIVALASSTPSIFGLDLLSNASIFLKSVGMGSSTSLLFMMAGIVAGMAANLAGIWVVSRVGRRRLILTSLAFIAVCWGAMGVTGIWGPRSVKAGDGGGQGEAVGRLAWAAAACMMSALVAAGLGCWPASFAVAGETSSLQLRAPTQGVGGVATQAASTAMAVALPFVFGPDAAALGLKTGFVMCGVSVAGLALHWLFLPEMKDRTMAELDAMFEMKMPTREFRHWRESDERREE
ncbi:hypothetical protein GGTG_07582 [Gaeumannomyces tritici R3-111a-1]|uniref:Major facilitator superfamily (MFS) profile domain-containing protein n=1 Tax=Gaeumannomyces tritici (strain R3-111a-1) TaxID=644352 RepID=J3P234_GAET3|nr:hypothetical protein GGTG_07582 [Gaeumannomyces tritici R3-111a-1]EJT73726.1 hypothetical protein GGTG_07582 [Gaeumannomyces tritici R3-111a-1]